MPTFPDTPSPDPAILKTFRKLGSILQGHPDWRKTPGLDMTSGSLGHGLSVGLGMALASRQSGHPYMVYVLMSDGEMQEGMVWEAAMAAAHHHVGNLTVFVDKNRFQVDGPVAEILNIDPLPDKWEAFGWKTFRCDGNDMESIPEPRALSFATRSRVRASPSWRASSNGMAVRWTRSCATSRWPNSKRGCPTPQPRRSRRCLQRLTLRRPGVCSVQR